MFFRNLTSVFNCLESWIFFYYVEMFIVNFSFNLFYHDFYCNPYYSDKYFGPQKTFILQVGLGNSCSGHSLVLLVFFDTDECNLRCSYSSLV